MKSSIVKRSVVIQGHKTSVSLEQPFWDTFRDIAEQERVSTSALLRRVDAERQHSNLSSAIRVFVLKRLRDTVSDAGLGAHAQPAEAPQRVPDGPGANSVWLASPRASAS